ncbi:MAG: hemerythrin domain-containing protein [Saprospiraceae bacterium]
MSGKPLKRHPGLVELSRDHHHGLLLCWKIREGLKRGTEPALIKRYVDFFVQKHLEPHFQEEEKFVFPLLPQEHPLIEKALAQHETLRQLFGENTDLTTTLSDIAGALDAHIRFEERELFEEIQRNVSEEQLLALTTQLKPLEEKEDPEKWADVFWVSKS